MEYRGKQDLWLKTRPDVMKTLLESAIVQSAESSNRIEGVEVERTRLRPLLLGTSRPQNRSEEEVLGYKNALLRIFKKYNSIEINPATIKILHKIAQSGLSGDAGQWKERNNSILELHPTGDQSIRFTPTSAKETPKAVALLCDRYRKTIEDQSFPDLAAIAAFILDFLCIHPFRDGNGRVSRLLTTLLLCQQGYGVGRFISLERLVEQSKEDYYEVLLSSSKQWHTGKHDVLPWFNYFMSILKRAYSELAERVDLTRGADDQSSIIRQIIGEQLGSFSLSDIHALVPSASSALIKKILSEMKKEGFIQLSGKGRGAQWRSLA